ncbi:MAG: NAD(P)/FAD-dependent oxidoreductase [Myxococcota bacterium]
MSHRKIDRRAFLAQCRALGLGLPWLPLLLEGCGEDVGGLYSNFEVGFSGRVIVVGAGASGLAAGYLLQRYGIDFEILEASSDIGGRVKRAPDFADFPIDVGAEWIHEDPVILANLIDDSTVEGSIDVVPYSPDTVYTWSNGRLNRLNAGGNFYSEFKFKSTTWYGFLETYFASGFRDRISLDTPVTRIDTQGDGVIITDAQGMERQADRVLITVPVQVLRSDIIEFTPALPQAKRDALDQVQIPDGIKVFIEFSERFYPDILLVGAVLSDSFTEKIYYDAAFRKDSGRNVMGLFWVSEQASEFTSLGSDQEIVDAMLAELDQMFDGQASSSYVDHVVQNWSQEPYIRGAYSTGFGTSTEATQAALIEPVDDKLFFSGEALATDNSATVPGAMQSAYAAIEALLRS